MLIVETYPMAVLLCVVTMICWGSWGNTQKLAARSWRFELFYWDYVIGILLFSLLFGLTAGSAGTQGRSMLTDLRQADPASLTSAFTGGIIFNAANILFSAAIAIAGLAVAFPVAIGIALVLGVVLNYAGSRHGDPLFLFGGVAFVVLAIILNAAAYRRKAHGQKGVGAKGLLLSLLAGILMSFFYRFIAVSMDLNDFHQPAPGKMTPYSAVLIFSIGTFASNFIFNTILMRKPFDGPPVSYADYFKGRFPTHLVGILGGLIWGLGNSLNLLASGLAGPAISYGLGQGATLVAAAWGVFIWKEFSPAPVATRRLLTGMFICFIIGITFIILAGTKDDKPAQKLVIFDTDMGPDYDDAGAIAILHALADSGKVKILATMASTKYEGVAGVLSVFNTYFQRPDIPVGIPRGEAVDQRDFQHWTDSLLANYPHAIRRNDQAEDAVILYRKLLSEQKDNSVDIISVGFFTNLSNLLQSKPDRYSPLDGTSLVAKKVRSLYSMAGAFPGGKEFNIFKDAGASRYALTNCPSPVVFSGFEIGQKIKCGLPLTHNETIQNSPVKDVFRISIPLAAEDSGGRMSWDETAVLVGVLGSAPWYTTQSGRIDVAQDGSNTWDPKAGGQSYLIEQRPVAEVRDLIDRLIQHQPAH